LQAPPVRTHIHCHDSTCTPGYLRRRHQLDEVRIRINQSDSASRGQRPYLPRRGIAFPLRPNLNLNRPPPDRTSIVYAGCLCSCVVPVLPNGNEECRYRMGSLGDDERNHRAHVTQNPRGGGIATTLPGRQHSSKRSLAQQIPVQVVSAGLSDNYAIEMPTFGASHAT